MMVWKQRTWQLGIGRNDSSGNGIVSNQKSEFKIQVYNLNLLISMRILLEATIKMKKEQEQQQHKT